MLILKVLNHRVNKNTVTTKALRTKFSNKALKNSVHVIWGTKLYTQETTHRCDPGCQATIGHNI